MCGREVKTVVLKEMGWFAMDNDRGESSNGVINGVDETKNHWSKALRCGCLTSSEPNWIRHRPSKPTGNHCGFESRLLDHLRLDCYVE